MNLQIFYRFLRLPYTLRLLFAVFFILLLFGTTIHLIEPDNFPTIFDGVWWAIVTTSTTGYGDFVPTTVKGKLVGMLLIFTGAGLVASTFIAIATNTVKKKSSIVKGTMHVRWKHHFIIIGWNERSKEIINCYREVHPDQTIVLIDSTLKESPFAKKSNIIFVKGSGASDKTLLQANIQEADLILVTADPTRTEFSADMNTILNIVAIKGVAPKIYCVAEILTDEQVINAKRAGANEVIQSNKLISSIMNHSMSSHGIADAILDIVDSYHGIELKFIKEKSLIGHTFEAAMQVYLHEQKVLIGIKRGDKIKVAPKKEAILESGDQLLIISHN